MSQEYIEIKNAKCLEHRRKGYAISAIKFIAPQFTDPQWMPYACIHDDSEVYKAGDEGALLVKAWFAKKMDWM